MEINCVASRKMIRISKLAVLCSAITFAVPLVHADEGGVSFWLPGQFGSMAAVPGDPGWSLPLIYFHSSVDIEGSREVPTAGRITLGLEEDIDLLLAAPTYAFANPVWGGQLTLSVAGVYGNVDVGVKATLDTGGNQQSGEERDSNTDIGDLFPSATLRWNHGVHNSMAYLMAGAPVGEYEVGRLANIGTNHWSLDAGGGYTYLNMETGREFSAVAGLTYNFENPDTDYQNGIDSHLDLAASQFVSEQMHIGLVGYIYYQLTGDSGPGAILGDFESSVIGLGPQLGYFFNTGEKQAYLNVKGYWEVESKHRPKGWNAWLTLALPL